MAKFIKRKSIDIGLSPYVPTFVGEQRMDETKIRLLDFTVDQLESRVITDTEQLKPFAQTPSQTWVNIDGIHDAHVLESVSKIFNLDSTIIPEVMNTRTRPFARQYEDCVYVATRRLVRDGDKMGSRAVRFVIGKHFLISFREQDSPVFDVVVERLQRENSRMRREGVDYLLFVLLDIIIDNYTLVLNNFGDLVSEIEDRLLEDEKADNVAELINERKRELSFIKRTTKPMNDVVMNLLRMTDILDDRAMLHMRELWNNMLYVNDEIDSYREVLTDQLDIHNTNMNNALNERINFLTIFSVIFIPLTFIAGIYGTNFEVVPELSYPNAYFIMWGVMIVIAIGMIGVFKYKNWF